MSISVFGTMLGYILVCSFTPGPGNILALNTTTQFGWQKGKRLILGICAGYACVQFLCTLAVYGLNTFLLSVLAVLKYIGTIYMVWLAVHIFWSKPLPSLLLAGVGVVSVGSTACLTWAFLGIKMQRIYEKHYKPINSILSLFLLYCAWDIVKG